MWLPVAAEGKECRSKGPRVGMSFKVKIAKGDSIVVILVQLKADSIKLSFTLFILVGLFSLAIGESVQLSFDLLSNESSEFLLGIRSFRLCLFCPGLIFRLVLAQNLYDILSTLANSE